MRFGLAIFATDETPPPGEVARLVESRGFESLLFPEHTHIPAARETPYPAGGDLPRYYERTLDPFVACTAAAAATEHLLIGIGVCLVIQRDPIVTAKEVASVDHLSGGRFLFGVGAGWNREEMRHHGTDPRTRFALLEERVRAMQAIWSHEEASYDGEHVRFDRVRSWPKPVQRPHPPILVGGNGPTVLDRVLAYGDHWHPNPHGDDERLLGRVEILRHRAAEAGREVGVTLNAVSAKPERLARYAGAGIERCVFYLPHGDMGEIEARIDRVEAAIEATGLALAPA
jgi:probable F420-dependent oxidoreductase